MADETQHVRTGSMYQIVKVYVSHNRLKLAISKSRVIVGKIDLSIKLFTVLATSKSFTFNAFCYANA